MHDSPLVRLLNRELEERVNLIQVDFEDLFKSAGEQMKLIEEKSKLIRQYAAALGGKQEEVLEEIRQDRNREGGKKEANFVSTQVLPIVPMKISEIPAGVNKEERIVGSKLLLDFCTEEYSTTASPSTLVMQVYYPLEIWGEVFDVALVLVFGEKHPSTFRMCFPHQLENYRPLLVSVDILDFNGSPVISKSFEVNPQNGNCRESKGSWSWNHKDCANPSYICKTFFSGEDCGLFQKCLRKKVKRPNRVTFFPARVSIEEANFRNATGEDEGKILESNESGGDTSQLPLPVRTEFISSASHPEILEDQVDSPGSSSRQEYFTDPIALNNLSKEAMLCYSDWLTSGDSTKWIHDVDINLELLHFAYKYNVSNVKEKCRKHILDLSAEICFTQSQCMEILAAAFMHRDSVLFRVVSVYTGKCYEEIRQTTEE